MHVGASLLEMEFGSMGQTEGMRAVEEGDFTSALPLSLGKPCQSDVAGSDLPAQ